MNILLSPTKSRLVHIRCIHPYRIWKQPISLFAPTLPSIILYTAIFQTPNTSLQQIQNFLARAIFKALKFSLTFDCLNWNPHTISHSLMCTGIWKRCNSRRAWISLNAVHYGQGWICQGDCQQRYLTPSKRWKITVVAREWSPSNFGTFRFRIRQNVWFWTQNLQNFPGRGYPLPRQSLGKIWQIQYWLRPQSLQRRANDHKYV